VELSHTRAYYQGPGCGPDDPRLGLEGPWSPTRQPAVTRLGALVPFATASDRRRQLLGLRFAAATCRRVSERVGADRLAPHPRQQVAPPPRLPDWNCRLPERDGQRFPGTVGSGGLDAFAVPTRGAGGVDGKRLSVGVLDDPPKGHTRYLVAYDFERLAGLRRP
jgi:hypothetical protein